MVEIVRSLGGNLPPAPRQTIISPGAFPNRNNNIIISDELADIFRSIQNSLGTQTNNALNQTPQGSRYWSHVCLEIAHALMIKDQAESESQRVLIDFVADGLTVTYPNRYLFANSITVNLDLSSETRVTFGSLTDTTISIRLWVESWLNNQSLLDAFQTREEILNRIRQPLIDLLESIGEEISDNDFARNDATENLRESEEEDDEELIHRLQSDILDLAEIHDNLIMKRDLLLRVTSEIESQARPTEEIVQEILNSTRPQVLWRPLPVDSDWFITSQTIPNPPVDDRLQNLQIVSTPELDSQTIPTTARFPWQR